MIFRVPDPTPDLKKQFAAVLATDAAGWASDYAAANSGADYSMMSKVRNGDLRRISLQRLVRMAARRGIETRLDLRAVDLPGMLTGRIAPAVASALARDGATASGIRTTVIFDEALMRGAHAITGIISRGSDRGSTPPHPGRRDGRPRP